MKAVVLKDFGGPENLVITEVPTPSVDDLNEGEVLVRVGAVGVCYHDIINRRGDLPRTNLPAILGHEIAGEVVGKGPAADSFRMGDHVATVQRVHCSDCHECDSGRPTLCKDGAFFGEEIQGGYAEFVVAKQHALSRVPDDLPLEEASIAACTIGTAIHVTNRGHVTEGEDVLITGASGGVGMHMIQVCKLAGARVIAATSSPEKERGLYEAGADEVVVAPDLDFSREVRHLTSNRGVQVAIEITGAITFDAAVRSLAPGGRLVMVGSLETRPVSFLPGLMILKELEFIGSFATTTEELSEAFRLIMEGKVRPMVSEIMSLDDVAKAHSMLYERQISGRVVLRV
jgi:acryloyl-coenzyme A reductase